MPELPGVKVTSISVLNGDIGPSAVRSRSIGAASLADAVPFMGDNAYLFSCYRSSRKWKTSLPGTHQGARSRQRGRIPAFDEFVKWGDTLVSALESNPTPAAFFERFASPVSEPSDTTPTNILLEVATIEHSFVDSDGKTLNLTDACAEVALDDTCSDSEFKHAFSVSINESSHKVWLRWSVERSKYVLESPQLDLYHELGKPRVTLTSKLNATQDFRVILASSRVLYAAGQFYDFMLRFGRGTAATLLLDLLSDLPPLANISTEKGARPKGTSHSDWDTDSLFHYIDKGMPGTDRRFGMRFSHVVCDDMGTEGGDFIGIEESGAVVVFAQAKCKRDATQVAASALYDVCAQANKNLGYLRYGGGECLGGLESGSVRGEAVQKDSTYKVSPRIRHGSTPGTAFLEELNAALSRPGTRREMWLVLGKTLSKRRFETELTSEPPASAIQTFSICSCRRTALVSLLGSNSASSVRLDMLCQAHLSTPESSGAAAPAPGGSEVEVCSRQEVSLFQQDPRAGSSRDQTPMCLHAGLQNRLAMQRSRPLASGWHIGLTSDYSRLARVVSGGNGQLHSFGAGLSFQLDL